MARLTFDDLKTAAYTRVTVAADSLDVTSGLACRVFGLYVSEETATTTTVVRIYDETTITGTDFIEISVTGVDSKEMTFGPNGTRFDLGLTIDVVTGTPGGVTVLYLIDE